MTQNVGTLVTAPIRPFDSADLYPTHEAIYGKGGVRTVASTTARDAIPALRREEGMLVYVAADQKTYQLAADLVTWAVANLGGIDPTTLPPITNPVGTDKVLWVRSTTTGLMGYQAVRDDLVAVIQPYVTQAQNSATAASGSASAASASASNAAGSATAALNSAAAAQSSKLAADADAAATAADRTATHNDKLAADSDVVAAAASASAATTSANNALSSANLSQEWAQNPEDVPVISGQFSAFNWARKAQEAAGSIVLPGAISRTQSGTFAVLGDSVYHTVPLPSQIFGDASKFSFDSPNNRIVPNLSQQERLLSMVAGAFAASAGGTMRGLRLIARDPNSLSSIQTLIEVINPPNASSPTTLVGGNVTLPPLNWLIELQAMHDFVVATVPQNINLSAAFATVSMVRGEKGDIGPPGTLALAGFATFDPHEFVATGGETSFVLPNTVTLTAQNQVVGFRNGVFQYGLVTTLPRTIVLPAAAVAGDDFLFIIFSAATGAVGPQGKNAFTTTGTNFTQPAVGSTVSVPVLDTSWMASGENVFIAGGGTYSVFSITDATHVILTNLGQPENASPGVTVGGPAQVTPSGVRGAAGGIGSTGAPAYTNTTSGFTQPNVGNTVVVPVISTAWMISGETVFLGGGAGTYTVQSIGDATHVTLTNTGQPENAAPGTSIANGILVSPSGVRGTGGSNGANGFLSGNVVVFTATAQSPWVVPAGVTKAKVWCKGPGGAGANGGATVGGGGGGEGGEAVGIIALTPGESISFAIPASAAATTFASSTRLFTANQGADAVAGLAGTGGSATVGAAVSGWTDAGADAENANTSGAGLNGGKGAGKGSGRAATTGNASRAGAAAGAGGGGGLGSPTTPTNGAAGFRGEIRIEY